MWSFSIHDLGYSANILLRIRVSDPHLESHQLTVYCWYGLAGIAFVHAMSKNFVLFKFKGDAGLRMDSFSYKQSFHTLSPWLFEVVSVTVDLYTTYLVRHLPSSGQEFFFSDSYIVSIVSLLCCETFLTSIRKHFPKDKSLSKIFDRNTIKVSYSCLPNVQQTISNNNNRLLQLHRMEECTRRDSS